VVGAVIRGPTKGRALEGRRSEKQVEDTEHLRAPVGAVGEEAVITPSGGQHAQREPQKAQAQRPSAELDEDQIGEAEQSGHMGQDQETDVLPVDARPGRLEAIADFTTNGIPPILQACRFSCGRGPSGA
jgi:hypothetical protein